MNQRNWPVLAAGFGTLVALILFSGIASLHQTEHIYSAVTAIHESHARTEDALRDLESQVYLSSIYARDFLLDLSDLGVERHREELRAIRTAMDYDLKTLARPEGGPNPKVVAELRREVDAYWTSMEPIFQWTSAQKLMLSAWFLRKQVLPRRQAVLKIAREAKDLNAFDLAERQRRMDASTSAFRAAGERMLAIVIGLSVVAAVVSILRVLRLQARAEQQHRATERAEAELRRLSRKLVGTQEEERRNLARELHDEVGQTITALRVELGNVEKLRSGPEDAFRSHLEEAKELAAQTLRSVRSIATGLRPAVLDDLGVAPALEWQAREFTRRTGIPVEVVIDGLPEQLPEGHRTCLYRIVQEALTNCARHSEASSIRVALHTDNSRLSLVVQDNGRGFEPTGTRLPPSGGLGLVGIGERVRELGGEVTIQSQPGKGTVLKTTIPVPVEETA